MARSRLNYLLYCKKVIAIVNENYKEGWTTYAAIWRNCVNPIYPMSYAKFIKIINMPNLNGQIEQAQEIAAKAKNKRNDCSRMLQLDLFQS